MKTRMSSEKSVSGTSQVKAAEHLAWREVADEVVLLHPDESILMGLNGSGGHLWKALIGEELSVQQAAESLAGAFDVESAEALADTRTFVEQLLSRGLVSLVE